jgi:metal-responsive CopG/Arc/MetJ family transcriptional regulator
MAKLIQKLQAKQQVKKKKVTFFLPEDLLEELEQLANQLSYGKRKSELIGLLLEHSLEQVRKELEKNKQPKREV